MKKNWNIGVKYNLFVVGLYLDLLLDKGHVLLWVLGAYGPFILSKVCKIFQTTCVILECKQLRWQYKEKRSCRVRCQKLSVSLSKRLWSVGLNAQQLRALCTAWAGAEGIQGAHGSGFHHVLVSLDGTVQLCFCRLLSIVEHNEKTFPCLWR